MALYGVPYEAQAAAEGGTAPYQFRATGLHAGLNISESGLISGVPSAPGPGTVTISVTDKQNATASRVVNLPYQAGALQLSGNPPGGKIGFPYYARISVLNGTAPVRFSISEGALPTGLQLRDDHPSTAVIEGMPERPGTYPFRIQATDARQRTASFPWTITIADQAIRVSPTSVPDGIATELYQVRFTATGGVPPYRFRNLKATPTNYTLTDSGVFSGFSSDPEGFVLQIEATDSTGASGSRIYSVRITGGGLTLLPYEIPPARLREAYSVKLTASGGTPPYSFRVITGKLTDGLALSPDGTLAGTPEKAIWSTSFEVGASDAAGKSGVRRYQMHVEGAKLTISPSSLPAATAGTPYSVRLSTSGGLGPYRYELTYGVNWPVQLRVTEEGVIEGTPVAGSPVEMRIQVTDANGSTALKYYVLTIRDPNAIVLSPAELTEAETGQSYRAVLIASGGREPYSLAMTQGSLPPGLTGVFGEWGEITGVPSQAGEYPFTVLAQDSSGRSVRKEYSIRVNTPAIRITPEVLPDASRDLDYRQQVSAEGGTAPYRFILASGQMPEGLSLDAAGLLAGRITVPGNWRFAIRATDAAGLSAIREYVLRVVDAITIDPDAVPPARIGEAYRIVFRVVGLSAPSLRLTGNLPAGVSFVQSSMTLAGTPREAGRFGFALEATATGADRVVRQYTLEVIDAPRLKGGTLGEFAYGEAVERQLTAEGGVPPYEFWVSSGDLPHGLRLSPAGSLKGTPWQSGEFRVQVTARDATGNIGSGEYSLAVMEPERTRVDGVTDAASGTLTVVRGGFATIYGHKLADRTGEWSHAIEAGRLPTELHGVSVRVNRQPAYVAYVSPTQVNVLVPPDVAPGTAAIELTNAAGNHTVGATVSAQNPALFTLLLGGSTYAVAHIANTATVVAPAGALPGGRPVVPGELIELYASGLGITRDALPAGQVLTTDYPVADLEKIRVSIGGVPARVLYAGMTFAGVYQVNLEVPAGLRAGDHPVVLQAEEQKATSSPVLSVGAQ